MCKAATKRVDGKAEMVVGHVDRPRRADAPTWGRALASAGFANLSWQPLGAALYNRRITD